jgi:hypothetical protein
MSRKDAVMSDVASSEPPSPNRRVSYVRLVELVAPALGQEKSAEVILSTAMRLDFPVDDLNLERALEILTSLGSQPGIVGIAARFAKTRLLSPRKLSSKPPRTSTGAPGPEKPVPGKSDAETVRMTTAEVAALLSHTLGTAKSEEVVAAALSQLGVTAGALDLHQALAVLEHLAGHPGLVGVASRFAKARLILRLNPS